MLTITVEAKEFWNEEKQEFVYFNGRTIQMEHSLVSVAKWESKWKKPFLVDEEYRKKNPITTEMSLDYYRFMTITQNVEPELYYSFTQKNVDDIQEYINDPSTATWFGDEKKGGKKDTRPMTAERIYHLMIHYNIPFECQKWHLNRLMTLIRVCYEEEKEENRRANGGKSGQTPKEAAMARHNMNKARNASRRHH